MRVMAIVAMLSVILPLSASAQGRARGRGQGQAAIRFAAMDRNGDRVIDRAEWRGSDRSFRVHDWNGDGVLSGNEVNPGAVRDGRPLEQEEFGSPNQDYGFDDWTARGFTGLDHDRNGRITREEWHFDSESFRRADRNRDGILSRPEFLATDPDYDDDRGDRFRDLDENDDGRVTRDEWHGSAAQFNALDRNRDRVLSRTEVGGEPPTELFTSVDVNRDDAISRDEWHWSRASFDTRDANGDARLSREEFGGMTQQNAGAAFKAGYDSGVTEGRTAGREDRERNQGWDLEGQRELESADSGYESRVGRRDEFQAGYREGFRVGYREGFGRQGR